MFAFACVNYINRSNLFIPRYLTPPSYHTRELVSSRRPC
jgi:hypothetical protein